MLEKALAPHHGSHVSVDLAPWGYSLEAVIWVDLDKTLVYVRDEAEDQTLAMLAPFYGVSADLIRRPPRKGRRRLRGVNVRGVEYRGCVRHGAHDFLRQLRRLAEVRMLTSAQRPYALAMNAAFELGFKKTQVFAREDWMDVPTALRATEHVQGTDPDGVLIDNETDDWHHRRKIAYLGARGRLVMVRDFTGYVDDGFKRDWPRHVEEVRSLMQETGAETNARLRSEIEKMLAPLGRDSQSPPQTTSL